MRGPALAGLLFFVYARFFMVAKHKKLLPIYFVELNKVCKFASLKRISRALGFRH